MSKAIKITDNGTEIIPASLDERIEARVRCAMRMINGNMSDIVLLRRLNNYSELVAEYRRYQSDFGAERYIDALVLYMAYRRLAEARGLQLNGGAKE